MTDTAKLVAFGEAWARLGDKVREQARDVLSGADLYGDANPAAIRLTADRLRGLSGDVDAKLASWLDA